MEKVNEDRWRKEKGQKKRRRKYGKKEERKEGRVK